MASSKEIICIKSVTPAKKEYIQPLTDRVCNMLYIMAHGAKQLIKSKKEGCPQVVGCKRRNDNEFYQSSIVNETDYSR